MLVDIIAASKVSNPEEIVIDQEDYASMEEIAKMLSSLESSAYLLSARAFLSTDRAALRTAREIGG